MSRSLKQDIILFFILLFLFGIIGYLIGVNRYSFDTYNYHLYSPYALLNNRIGYDIMPSGVRSYFNPIMDIPFYFMVKYLNNFGGLISILLSINTTIFGFVVYKINKIFLRKHFYLNLVATLLSMTGAVYIIETSSTYCDYLPATFILLSLYFLLKAEVNKKNKIYAIAGIMTGIGVGLKLSIIPMAISFLIVLLITRKNLKNILSFCFGSLFSWIFTGGIWHFYIWYKFKNPFFPFFNNIFKSPYYPNENIYSSDYKNIKLNIPYIVRVIIWPFTILNDNFLLYRLDYYFIDPRPLLQYLSFFPLFFRKRKSKRITFLLYWVLFSYLLWVWLFCDLRYAMPLWAFSGLILSLALLKYTKRIYAITISLFILMSVCCTKYPLIRHFEKIGLKEKLYTVANYDIPDNSTVILASQASTLPIVWLNKNAKYIHLVLPENYKMKVQRWAYIDVDYVRSPYFEKILKDEFNNKNKEFYIILLSKVAGFEDVEYKKIINKYSKDFTDEFLYKDCEMIISEPTYGGFVLCKLNRKNK